VKRAFLPDSIVEPPPKKRAPIMSPFLVGEQKFHYFTADEVFYSDKTRYIPQLEKVGRALIAFRPRRFGKTLLMSMLSHYYDIHNEACFDELFGHLYIGKVNN
jgi:hypothetical protein